MNIGYIKKADIPVKIIDKIKCLLKVVQVEQFEIGCVFKIPIGIKEEKQEKTIKRLLIKMQKLKIDALVFSDEILTENYNFYEKLNETLCQNNKQILDGKRLMQYMNFDIFCYILNLQKAQISNEDIFFLIQKDNNLDLQFLVPFVESCKTVNIVTNDINRFKKVQENLYEKENILISVSNNKSKSLKKAKYIFNINMEKNEIKKYKMDRNAIIVHFKDNIKMDNCAFSGININYFQIDMPDEYIEKYESFGVVEKFDKVKLYESILLKKVESEKKKSVILSKTDLARRKNIVKDIIKKDNIKITGLIGNNGRIDETEIIRNYQIGKIKTNSPQI